MKFLNIIRLSVFQILSFIFVLGFLLGILNVHFSDKNVYCGMTYMFEYPQFVHITVPENNAFSQYGLYAYSEGRFTERARKMWFDGVPVLFLPGNSGSHMQARSLASVALRKALSSEKDFHFDYFTISYNEELSGLYGGVLQSQTEFAATCINTILNLYRGNKYTKTIPTSVILIGHSMGGLIAKRLLSFPSTLNTTSIALVLAAPLEAPVINSDVTVNDFYLHMNAEWDLYINKNKETKNSKILLSFGNGPADVLVPSGLTYSNDCYISALTTAIPGVWVSPDHVAIVWCKQLVLAINRYLFSVVDAETNQISEDKRVLMSKAKQYFEANRSMILSPEIARPNVKMLADAFWYEDNRRIYQISRPGIDKTTYLMIRLVNFPQNRFVAIEATNLMDKDWIFGCNAKFSYNTYRYCNEGISLTELSRWTGTALGFGRRKLATVQLHRLKDAYPDWTHVVVKVSPTRKPIVLNVDINDLGSRQITVQLPSDLSFGKTIIKQETEPNSLYYELDLPGFNNVHQAYLLYVEPTASCNAASYHVSAEVHVPWAKNNEYFHYYTHLKHSPMRLRLFRSNPNRTNSDESGHVKVTILLDPQCTYTISISTSWYNRLAQMVRNYTPVLPPYMAAILLLAVRSNIMNLKEKGTCTTINVALMSEGVKPYYSLVFARLGVMAFISVPLLACLVENASWNNLELQYFTRSLLVLPVYMTALGLVNITAAAILAVMVFSSQLAHRLLFRIIWRGGATSLAEKMATGLQKVPMVVSAMLVCAAPLSCGAASLVAGAAFYAFMLSKMYEEYLEDYVYKLMAKVASRICRIFKSKNKQRKESETLLVAKESDDTQMLDTKSIENNASLAETDEIKEDNRKLPLVEKDGKIGPQNETNIEETDEKALTEVVAKENDNKQKCDKIKSDDDVDEELNNLNFHVTMFCMWLCVTLSNGGALLTWARNFKYSVVLKPDTSYHTGLAMSACSAFLWQMNGPRKNLRHYDGLAALLFTMAVVILILGPFSLTIVSYGVTFMFIAVTLQQLLDKEETVQKIDTENGNAKTNDDQKDKEQIQNSKKENVSSETNKAEEVNSNENDSNSTVNNENSEECVCNENRIYNVFKRLQEKFSFGNDN